MRNRNGTRLAARDAVSSRHARSLARSLSTIYRRRARFRSPRESATCAARDARTSRRHFGRRALPPLAGDISSNIVREREYIVTQSDTKFPSREEKDRRDAQTGLHFRQARARAAAPAFNERMESFFLSFFSFSSSSFVFLLNGKTSARCFVVSAANQPALSIEASRRDPGERKYRRESLTRRDVFAKVIR